MQWWVSLFWTLNYVLNFSKVNRLFKISRLYHIYQAIPAYHEPSRPLLKYVRIFDAVGVFGLHTVQCTVTTIDYTTARLFRKRIIEFISVNISSVVEFQRWWVLKSRATLPIEKMITLKNARVWISMVFI